MSGYFAGCLDDDEPIFGPSAQASASAESTESQITVQTTETEDQSDSDDRQEPIKKESHKAYPMAKKLEVIDYANKHGNHAAARFFKVDRSSVRYWKDKEARYRRESYSRIFAMDETSVELEPSSGRVFETKGAKDVTVLSTGHERSRVTVALTGRSDGKKLKPLVLLPRTKPMKDVEQKWGSKLHLVWAGQGLSWMNNGHIETYLRKVIGACAFQKTLLCWDSFVCHFHEETKKVLKELGIHTAVIPSGCTKFIQPPDTDWNQPFKAGIRREYEHWINQEDRPQTKGGNQKAPDVDTYLGWIDEAWKGIPEEAIAKSFKNCGITNALDGSEDERIACFRPTGAIPVGLIMLAEARKEREIELVLPELEDEEQNFINGFGELEIV